MELLILNVSMVLYLLISAFQLYRYQNTMTESAFHHKLSHFYIVLFFFISINLYDAKGYIYPLLFAFLHMVQHVMKEDIRLIKTNKWTKDVPDV